MQFRNAHHKCYDATWSVLAGDIISARRSAISPEPRGGREEGGREGRVSRKSEALQRTGGRDVAGKVDFARVENEALAA